MTSEDVSMLWESMTAIEAQDELKKMVIADWPNMKKSQRDKRHKELFAMAYPSEIRTKNSISVNDLKKFMGQK
jgi:hypothetical protein